MLIQMIEHHATSMPEKIAIQGLNERLSYQSLLSAVNQTQQVLNKLGRASTIALAMDNSPAWAVIDLAALNNKTPLIPIPGFFSDSQIVHAVEDGGVDFVITDNPARFMGIFGQSIEQDTAMTIAGQALSVFCLTHQTQALTADTAKITYTSGTTGQPKGVCLSKASLVSVAQSVCDMVKLDPNGQHVCVLPLSTLLENVAGLYATLLAGATAHVMPSAAVGLNGNALNVHALHHALAASQAHTAILIPELLTALVTAIENGLPMLNSLRFVAVGGASVSPKLLKQANQVGLPVFEGYGLSECASVVALNTPQHNKIGSVGKPLPHLNVKISEHNEVMVKGANYLGYTSNQAQQGDWLGTGDIGYLDHDGYLFINGRIKHIFITSFGRNVSPEWVERDLTAPPDILQACLFGEAKPWSTALIFAQPETSEAAIDEAVNQVNQTLPDYARVGKWLRIKAPFGVQNNQLTPNGRLKRDAIWQVYQSRIEALYATSTNKSVN